MKKVLLVSLVALLGFALCAGAATVTNQGQVITVTKLSETMDAGTATEDQSTIATPTDRMGLFVIECVVPSGTTNTLDLGPTIPKGSIILDSAVIEQSAALAGATNVALAVGGVAVIATGSTMLTTGIVAAVSSTAITTSADKLTLTILGTATTAAGKFTLYMPYIMGNASR